MNHEMVFQTHFLFNTLSSYLKSKVTSPLTSIISILSTNKNVSSFFIFTTIVFNLWKKKVLEE